MARITIKPDPDQPSASIYHLSNQPSPYDLVLSAIERTTTLREKWRQQCSLCVVRARSSRRAEQDRGSIAFDPRFTFWVELPIFRTLVGAMRSVKSLRCCLLCTVGEMAATIASLLDIPRHRLARVSESRQRNRQKWHLISRIT